MEGPTLAVLVRTVTEIVAGEILAVRLVERRVIETETVVVRTAPVLSVTVHSAWPVRVSPIERPVALNVVLAADGDVVVIPVPPLCHVQAKPNGEVPLNVDTVVEPVV